MADPARGGAGLDVVLAIWSRRKLPAIVVFSGLFAAGVTIAMALPGIYRSTATVLVERQQVADAFVRPSVTGELDTRLETINQEILSRARLEALIERFDLYPELRGQASREAAIERARHDFKVELKAVEPTGGRGTVAFAVSFRGRDPETVARVTNALASFYVDENLKMRERQATDTAQFLKVQLAETKRRLDEEEQRIGEFKRRHIGQLPEQVAVNLATMERLSAQLALNNSSQLQAIERRAALARQLAGGDSSGAAGAEDVPAARLARLRLELAKMQRLYTGKYPDVVRLRAEIAAVEQELAQAGPSTPSQPAVARPRDSVGEADAEIAALKAEEQRLRASVAAYQRRVEAAPELEQQLQQMSRDFQTTKELHDSMLKRYQDAQVAEDMERRRSGTEFRLLDPAIPARTPWAPNRPRLVLLSALIALGGAAGAMLLAERLDTSFHTVDDLREFTRIPVLATIPRIATAADWERRRTQFRLAAISVPVGLALVILAFYRFAHGNEQLVWMLSRGGS